MISRVDLRGQQPSPDALRAVLPRAELDVEVALDVVRPLCEDVRTRGAAAVRDLTQRFDGVDLESTRVPAQALKDALAALDPALRAALEEAAGRTQLVHESQRRRDAVVEVSPGGTVTERWLPVRRVGLYVPGGLLAYPSTVVMNVVPAQVAGVGSMAVASPPRRDNGGLPHPSVLAACALLGIEEVHAVGGAQAVAMFAYGTVDCAPADLVTGPGNIYVTSAKRALKGVIGIDSEAGPTEIAVLADDSADPTFLAADLVAQAEHDPEARALLITPNRRLAKEVAVAVRVQAAGNAIALASLARKGAIIVTRDAGDAMRLANELAPEHLVVENEAMAREVRAAGSVFVGRWSAQAAGDYAIGSNHVLPTAGAARFRGGLNTADFVRLISVQRLTHQGLARLAPTVTTLARAEGLEAHARSIEVRTTR